MCVGVLCACTPVLPPQKAFIVFGTPIMGPEETATCTGLAGAVGGGSVAEFCVQFACLRTGFQRALTACDWFDDGLLGALACSDDF